MGGVEGAFGETGAAGVAVVHEDGRQQRVRMQRHGHSADVPAVAGGEERQHSDRRVFGGVQRAAQDLRVDPCRVELVLGDRPPHGPGAQRAGRKIQLGLAEHLAGDQFATEEGDDLIGHFDGAVTEPPVPPGDLGIGLQDGDGGGVAGGRRVGRIGFLDERDRVLQIQFPDQIGAALVEVDGALVDGGVRGGLVDGAQQPAGALLDDLDGAAALAPDVGEVGGPPPPGPVPARGPLAEQLRGFQLRQQLCRGWAEEGQVRFGERQLGGGGAQVGGQHVRVVRVEDGRLHRLLEQRFGMVDEEGVQRVVAGHQDGEGALAGPPCAAGLLPQRGSGAWVTRDHDRVQAGDVDAEFEGGGGGQTEKAAGMQSVLQGAALLGEITPAVGGDPGGQRAVDLGEAFLGDDGNELGAAP